MKHIWNLLIVLDELINVIFNGRVETISHRANRARLSGKTWGCLLCKWLDKIQPNHCENTAE